MFSQLVLVVNGQQVDINAAMSSNPLIHAVILSLFTWRRANVDDVDPGEKRMGWCGDSLAQIPGDKFGSRLWLLCRAKLISETYEKAKNYAHEALKWIADDGVCASIDVQTERMGREGLAMRVILYREDRSKLLDLRFADIWGVVGNA